MHTKRWKTWEEMDGSEHSGVLGALSLGTTPGIIIWWILGTGSFTNGPVLGLFDIPVILLWVVILMVVAALDKGEGNYISKELENPSDVYPITIIKANLNVHILIPMRSFGVNIPEFLSIFFGFMEPQVTVKAMSACETPYEMYQSSLFAIVMIVAFALTLLCGAAAFFCQSIA
jgi:hypothetical protein